MPTYEMPLLLRIMKKPELVAALKRTAETIFNTGGFIRKIENCGVIPLPCKTSAHGHVHREANHFFIYFDIPPNEIDKITDKYNRDIDIVNSKIFKQDKPYNTKCTFHEETLPPPYRPSVQKLMEMAKKQKRNNKHEFKYNTGLDYYPFNK
ncbi:PREDICTED: probable 28S ribosomal protein S6, mitochondrial [Trachymyrmex septentrionalis]|uniref:probable 28S ribosomal protein S6, mitochondrial n=1 Tax=Trachymyrmex septentrionalis TaxID=34720 RepID=UPI00084F77BA|nr:PREDICTED: probable 28S ribosomal protein S6, mitochondrial [Trachymyrmex septentrionalis]